MSSDPTVPPAPVVVTKPPTVPATSPPDPPVAVADPPKVKGPLYFCLEATHPGPAGSGGRAEVYDTARFFDSDVEGAPFCPGCNRNVSALPVDDDTVLPPSIQLLKDRLQASERGAR